MTMRMKFRIVMALAVLLAGLAPWLAATATRAASSWGLPGEETARFEAKVVDIACELTGDCPQSCGDGSRQLGLLTDEGRLVLPVKNQVNFAGAAWELVDFCQQRVIADGLFVDNRGYEVFALQFVKPVDGDWRRANRFTNRWAEMQGVSPDSNQAKQWFRNDPTIDGLIEEQGKLGLGPEADEAYLDQ